MGLVNYRTSRPYQFRIGSVPPRHTNVLGIQLVCEGKGGQGKRTPSSSSTLHYPSISQPPLLSTTSSFEAKCLPTLNQYSLPSNRTVVSSNSNTKKNMDMNMNMNTNSNNKGKL